MLKEVGVLVNIQNKIIYFLYIYLTKYMAWVFKRRVSDDKIKETIL